MEGDAKRHRVQPSLTSLPCSGAPQQPAPTLTLETLRQRREPRYLVPALWSISSSCPHHRAPCVPRTCAPALLHSARIPQAARTVSGSKFPWGIPNIPALCTLVLLRCAAVPIWGRALLAGSRLQSRCPVRTAPGRSGAPQHPRLPGTGNGHRSPPAPGLGGSASTSTPNPPGPARAPGSGGRHPRTHRPRRARLPLAPGSAGSVTKRGRGGAARPAAANGGPGSPATGACPGCLRRAGPGRAGSRSLGRGGSGAGRSGAMRGGAAAAGPCGHRRL